MIDEIEGLRISEIEMQQNSEEADRLVRHLLPHYACDFALSDNVPPYGFCVLPQGWQQGLKSPVPFSAGFPPRNKRGTVAVSLPFLRAIAGRLP